MYHCHLHFYLIGCQPETAETLMKTPPLEHFTHGFVESSEPERELAAAADVIVADVHETDAPKMVERINGCRCADSKLILLADREQLLGLSGCFSGLEDIWTLPMSKEELVFRFTRWQEICRLSKELWQTGQYLEATINNIPNLIWYKDKNGIHEKVNDSFCRTVNKTKKQVEGRGHAYIWDVEQDDPACIESERIVMNSRKTCVSEETVQTGEGVRLLTIYKSPLYDLDGSVMGTVGVAIDTTQERAYEQEIIKKNHTLETIFTTMDCGIMSHTLDGLNILSVNRAALMILGYDSKEELLSSGFDMVAASVVDEDKPILRKAIQGLKKEGDSVSAEYRVRHKDGKILHIMGNVKLMSRNGELYYQRFLLDCTAQKLKEEKERHRQIELVHALSIDYNLVWFLDLDTGEGDCLRLDDCKLHTLSTVFSGNQPFGESMERYIEACVHSEDKETLREAVSCAALKRELTEKSIYFINYRTLCAGEVRYFQLKAVRAGSWEQKHGVVLGFRSVDEEIRSEIEKKNLLETALLQANRASKAKSVFLSNMSHDIRTPMNAIVGFTGLALTHIDHKEQVEEYLKKIMTSGNHLLSLINDILDMSRIESGKMHLDEKACSLPEILHGLYSIVQADIHAKQLELYMDAVDVLDEEIYCDKLRLNQVLLNLLSNAVKYTGAGGSVSLRITEKPGAGEGFGHYEFCIRDTGIGMSEEFVAHIFEPFERERTSTISGIQGTGLGN